MDSVPKAVGSPELRAPDEAVGMIREGCVVCIHILYSHVNL
jgi:hypothetical protein